MRPERKKFVALSASILIGMLICAFFMLGHSLHRSAFQLAFDGLMFLNFFTLLSFHKNRPQPDTLIRLFPESLATLKERP